MGWRNEEPTDRNTSGSPPHRHQPCSRQGKRHLPSGVGLQGAATRLAGPHGSAASLDRSLAHAPRQEANSPSDLAIPLLGSPRGAERKGKQGLCVIAKAGMAWARG